MLNSVKKTITPALSTVDDPYSAILKQPADMSSMRERYESISDPIMPITALCEAVSRAAGNAESVTVPAWAAQALAKGFSRYFESEIFENRSMSLEQCLGISKAAKGRSCTAMTNAVEMAGQVHLMRWQFGLKNIGLACRAVYDTSLFICEILGLPIERMGITQSEKSFQQYYERYHAKKYEAWKAEREAQGDIPTEERRKKVLSGLAPKLAGRIKREAKNIT